MEWKETIAAAAAREESRKVRVRMMDEWKSR